jgi:exopolysaccharide biosynthesis polyprenyl glycosylphosphotransferase
LRHDRIEKVQLRLGGDRTLAIAPAAPFGTPAEAGRRAARLRGVLRHCRVAACAFVPVLTILVPRHNGLAGLALALCLATVWLIAIELANRSARLSPLALGSRVTSALGAVAAVPAVILVDDFFPGVSSGELALTTAAVATSAIVFWGVAQGTPKVRSVIVVGAAAGGAELVHDLDAHASLPFRCLGLVSEAANGNGLRHGSSNGNGSAHVLGTVTELTEIVLEHRPDLVVLAGDRNNAMLRLLDAGPAELRVLSLPDFYEHAFGRVPVEHVAPVWFMSMLHLYRRPYPRVVKRVFDICLAGVALFLLLPVLPVIALLVSRSSPGPILYRQTRVGEGGRLFEILKFRTMVQDAEKPGQPIWAEVDDKRATPIGKFLRKTRLDEVPQFWNVLRGDMSVVGPRPERPEFLSLLQDAVPHWTRRHLVKPGITGWAQVRIGYTSDPVSALDKLSYDLYYLKHRGLLLDLAIAAKTAWIVFAWSGAR